MARRQIHRRRRAARRLASQGPACIALRLERRCAASRISVAWFTLLAELALAGDTIMRPSWLKVTARLEIGIKDQWAVAKYNHFIRPIRRP